VIPSALKKLACPSVRKPAIVRLLQVTGKPNRDNFIMPYPDRF
jgi:hypothetical protein